MAGEDLVPTPSASLFHFEDGRPSFEDLARENGFRNWSARQVMVVLGYDNWTSFRQVVNKAIATCTTINADVAANFGQTRLDVDGSLVEDFKLSKFACYLIAMQGDSRKREVALAQAYFAAVAEAFQEYIRSSEDVQRVEIRRRLSDHEKQLHGTANTHGIENYAFFQDAGYRGLYNMSLKDLRAYKGDPSGGKRPLLDYMGKRELAANLFRITETEAKITSNDLQGQRALQGAALAVGRSVRASMIEHGGATPEDLPLETDVKLLQSDLKKTQKGLAKGD